MNDEQGGEAIIRLNTRRFVKRFVVLAACIFAVIATAVMLLFPPSPFKLWVMVALGVFWFPASAGLAYYMARTCWVRVTLRGLEMQGLYGLRRRLSWQEVVNILPPMGPGWLSLGHEAMDAKHTQGVVLFKKSMLTDESIESLKVLYEWHRGQWPEIAEKVFSLYRDIRCR